MAIRRTGLRAAGVLAVRLALMADGFDVSGAVGAGLGDRQRTWDFIAEFAAAWARPLAPGDGCSEDVLWAVQERMGVQLPTALREAYLLFGRRKDLTARQDPLVSPDRLRVDHDGAVIMFRRENQYCAEWGVAATDPWNAEDPPVYVRRPDNRTWEAFADRMSLACAEMVLSEALLGAEFMDMCELPTELIGAAQSAYRQVTPAGVPVVVRHRDHQPLVRRARDIAAHGRKGTVLLADRRRADRHRPSVRLHDNPRPVARD